MQSIGRTVFKAGVAFGDTHPSMQGASTSICEIPVLLQVMGVGL